MANNEFVGSSLWVQWVSAAPAGTVQLDTEFRTFTYTPSISFIDATAGADTAARRIVSFKDGAVSYSALMQNDMGSAPIALLVEGVIGTLTWGEAGTAAGKPKVTLPAISQGMTRTAPYNDVVSISVNW